MTQSSSSGTPPGRALLPCQPWNVLRPMALSWLPPLPSLWPRPGQSRCHPLRPARRSADLQVHRHLPLGSRWAPAGLLLDALRRAGRAGQASGQRQHSKAELAVSPAAALHSRGCGGARPRRPAGSQTDAFRACRLSCRAETGHSLLCPCSECSFANAHSCTGAAPAGGTQWRSGAGAAASPPHPAHASLLIRSLGTNLPPTCLPGCALTKAGALGPPPACAKRGYLPPPQTRETALRPGRLLGQRRSRRTRLGKPRSLVHSSDAARARGVSGFSGFELESNRACPPEALGQWGRERRKQSGFGGGGVGRGGAGSRAPPLGLTCREAGPPLSPNREAELEHEPWLHLLAQSSTGQGLPQTAANGPSPSRAGRGSSRGGSAAAGYGAAGAGSLWLPGCRPAAHVTARNGSPTAAAPR